MHLNIQHEKIFINNPTKMCHASTIIKLQNELVLCAWFGGTREGSDDVDIWWSKKNENKWSTPQKLIQGTEPLWNPIFFKPNKNTVMLFYKIGREISKWRTMIMLSTDNAETWGTPYELVLGDDGTGGRGPVRNKPILLDSSVILAPGSTESGTWQAFVDISYDNGFTWTKSNNIFIENNKYIAGERTVNKTNIPVSEQSFYGRGVIQPTLWSGDSKNIHMFLRSSEGAIYRSDSKDLGVTWCNAYPTSLPNNNSGIDIVKMYNGNLVLAYNPISENWGKRTPMTLAISKDNGITWDKLLDLDTGDGEFSYPAIISDKNEIMVSYTYKREFIKFYKINIED